MFLMAWLLAAVSGCHDQRKGDAQTASGARDVEVPYLVGEKGIKYPYFQYEAADSPLLGDGEFGLAFFIHPMFETRRKGLALSYMPSDDMQDLFGEELFGRDFSAVNKDGILTIDGLPISRPLDMKPGVKWKMAYVDEVFECGVGPVLGDETSVRCVSSGSRPSLRFSKDRGLTSFQDPCGKGVCTYRLKTSVGLLSPFHLRATGL